MENQLPLQAALARTLRALRKTRGWTRGELSRRAGISLRFLADMEAGRANPSLLRLAAVARALGTDPGGLLTGEAGDPPGKDIVALLGLRGAGKSTVGPLLARRLGCSFVELDALVEEVLDLTLAQIFELHGEGLYRRTERDVLEELVSGGGPLVLATGGGLVTERETFDLLRGSCRTVWLRARPEDHWNRVVAQGDLRPMARDARAFESLRGLLAGRESLYRRAEMEVDTSRKSAGEVAELLFERFGSRGAGSSPQVR